MLVEFIKKCPWSFGSGRPTIFAKGAVREIDEKHATDMVRCDYAVLVEKREKEAEEGESEREKFWRGFSKSDLQAVCRNDISSYMPSVHRNVGDMVKLIMNHERVFIQGEK